MNDNRENFKEINTNLSYLTLEVQRVRTCNGILEMIFPLQIRYGFLSCCSIFPIIRPIFELFLNFHVQAQKTGQFNRQQKTIR